MLKILFIGDISGRPGREVVAQLVPQIKADQKIDICIANCENAAGGRGVTSKVINELTKSGIDFFTAGDHVWGIKAFKSELEDDTLPIVRPYNYERQELLPGSGYKILDLGKKGNLVVASLIGQVFMRENVRNPFWAADELLAELKSKGIEEGNSNIIIDFHAEATSEKVTLGNYLKNRVSAVVGTHTHTGTVDTRMLGSTAYVTDVGMAGPYDSSLWADFKEITHNFKFPFKKGMKMMESGSRVFNSVIIELDKGKAQSIKRYDKIIK
jgi:2',3'-cyclic-nucleotide 2'-phosphodiesterase